MQDLFTYCTIQKRRIKLITLFFATLALTQLIFGTSCYPSSYNKHCLLVGLGANAIIYLAALITYFHLRDTRISTQLMVPVTNPYVQHEQATRYTKLHKRLTKLMHGYTSRHQPYPRSLRKWIMLIGVSHNIFNHRTMCFKPDVFAALLRQAETALAAYEVPTPA